MRWVCPECGARYEAAGACRSDGAILFKTDDDLIGYPIGSYRIVELVNAAGMGRVYKAVQPSIGARVAVKVLSAELAKSPDLIERFFAEARAVNIIRHEQIINIIDLASLPDGRPYIVMEYLDGATLADTMRAYGPCPSGSFAHLSIDILGALAATHARGIVHRDLKPSNVFVSPQGRPKVLDFGIAKLDPHLGGNPSATNPGQLMGTPAYMAPEQAVGRIVDARVDIYAMGIILYEGITGKVPFDGETIYGVLHQVLQVAPRPPSQLRPGLPPAYEHVILRALAKDPAARFQSAREMAAALSAAAELLPPNEWAPLRPPGAPRTSGTVALRATPGGTRRRDHTPIRRRGRWLAVGGGLAAAAAVAIGLVLTTGPDPQKPIPVPLVVPDAPAAPAVAPAPTPHPSEEPPELHASRTDDGFLLNLGFTHAIDEVQVKLPDEAAFRSLGDRTWILLPPKAPRARIQVKYRRGDVWSGPFALVFDPDEIVLREAREALEAFPAWVEVQERNRRAQVSFAFIVKYGKAIRSIQYGFDEEVPTRPLPEGESRRDAPAGAKFVTVQVTFTDGSATPVRRFELSRDARATPPPPAVKESGLRTGVSECDSIFKKVAACYRATLEPDEFTLAATSLGQSAATIREMLAHGTPHDELVRTCEDLRASYRQANRGRGCEL